MVTLSFTIFSGQKNYNRAHMLFQVLCGFEPIFYTTHPNEEPNFMDNIIFERIWKDSNIIELKVMASSEYINVFQNCYVEDVLLENAADKINNYIKNSNEVCYLEFGNKIGNYTPAFSLNILPSDNHGHVKIEVDIEIADNDRRAHRCCFYVSCELGQIERFGQSLVSLISEDEGVKVSLV